METPNRYIKEYEEKLGKLPEGLEYKDSKEPEMGFRLKPPEGWKLSVTDGVAIPDETQGVGWPE